MQVARSATLSQSQVERQQFHHHESSRQIGDATTLADAGVQNGHTLRLIPEIIAG